MAYAWQIEYSDDMKYIDRILALRQIVFKESFSGKMSRDKWMWQFIQNPSGNGMSYLAVVNDEERHKKIVGQYVVIPIDYYLDNKLEKCSLSLDTMTHPDYQRQGMFTKLAKTLYEEIKNKGNKITIGFANDNSFPGFINKLGWYHVSDIPMFIKILRCDELLKIKNKILTRVANSLINLLFRNYKGLDTGDGLSIHSIETLENKKQEIYNIINHNKTIYPYIRCRNYKFFNWRFIQKPDNNYKIFIAEKNNIVQGYIVLSSFNYNDFRFGAIVDIFVKDENNIVTKALVSKAIKYFAKNNYNAISFIMLANNDFVRSIKELGFFKIPNWINKKKWHFIVRDHAQIYDINKLTDENNYYITWADTDVL